MNSDDQQMPARSHATRRLAQQLVRRGGEIQGILQHDQIRGMLEYRPGPLLADDLHPRQRWTETDVVGDLALRRQITAGEAVVQQKAAEVAAQLLLQQGLLTVQQQAAERSGEPGLGFALQGQPVAGGVAARLLVHDSSRLAPDAPADLRCRIDSA
ncbi:hypothetical protein D3C81_1515730 [compost metagenome]